jgi:hypothetical protein
MFQSAGMLAQTPYLNIKELKHLAEKAQNFFELIFVFVVKSPRAALPRRWGFIT